MGFNIENIDFIQGDKFRDLATFTYSPRLNLRPRDDYDDLQNTLDVSQLKDGDIIYTHMMYVKYLLDLMQYFSKRFILVTHSCDCSVEDYGIRQPSGRGDTKEVFEFTLTDNVIHWYSKNVNTINSRIESIPIGLENDRWLKKVPKLDIMRNQMHQHRGVRNLAYMNHSIKTNMEKRLPLYEMFEHEKWVTSKRGGNGIQFDHYIHQIYNHKFVFSPEGNGMDTIRTWEALYMGTIPIEKKNLNNRFYEDLPICFVNDWSEVNPDFLNAEYERIKSGTWNMNKLNFLYWKNKILNT
jgi:hypothetical protein